MGKLYNLSVLARLIDLLILVVVANACAFTQKTSSPTAPPPRIFIVLPHNIPSDTVWIRYVLRGSVGGDGAVVRREPNVHRYNINAMIGDKPAQDAKIVVYAPGCQFKAYTITFDGASEVSEHFRCDSLPSKTVYGFLPPVEIPSSIITNEKRLVISGELEPDWMCDFFLQPDGGSCLSGGLPLGEVGDLNPANKGAFEITIPDFARDPTFKGAGDVARAGDFGVIELTLLDRTIKRPVGGIQPENAAPKTGLRVESDYPNPIKFTRVR